MPKCCFGVALVSELRKSQRLRIHFSEPRVSKGWAKNDQVSQNKKIYTLQVLELKSSEFRRCKVSEVH